MPKMTAYRAFFPGPQGQGGGGAPGRNELGAMAYSELTTGTVEEYLAMESTVLNRVTSGLKSWVAPKNRGHALTEDDVITAPNQYQGVGRQNYEDYRNGVDNRGAQNAAQAERILRRTEVPTTKAVSFIVHRDGSPPTDEEIMRLGPNLKPAEPPKVGRVYLYELK